MLQVREPGSTIRFSFAERWLAAWNARNLDATVEQYVPTIRFKFAASKYVL